MDEMRIMLVDDNPVVRKAYEHACRDIEACTVSHAENGRIAVDMAEKTRPDIVVMDYYMPEMNGLDASRRILDMYPEAVIIVSTTCRKEELAEKMMGAGAALLVNKPVNRRLMADTLRNFTDMIRVRREPRQNDAGQPRDLSRLAERFLNVKTSGTTAADFAAETFDLFDHEIFEATEAMDRASAMINRLEPDFGRDEAKALAAEFYVMSRMLNVVREFPAMVYALNGIASFLETYDGATVPEKARTRMIDILREIDDMLFEWRRRVIDQPLASDINFIGQPLLYYGLQLETMYDL